jgi:hypothetical protein
MVSYALDTAAGVRACHSAMTHAALEVPLDTAPKPCPGASWASAKAVQEA